MLRSEIETEKRSNLSKCQIMIPKNKIICYREKDILKKKEKEFIKEIKHLKREIIWVDMKSKDWQIILKSQNKEFKILRLVYILGLIF